MRSRSAKPRVATSAVGAPRSSSSALVPTVIPWAKASTRSALAPARRRAASTAAITACDWSSGVVGTFAVCRCSPSKTTASVNVPPTSTPKSTSRSYLSEAPQTTRPRTKPRPSPASDALLRGERRQLHRLLEVLVGRAVVHPRQRVALTRRALAGRGPALARNAVQAQVRRQLLEELDREADVALDDLVDVEL